MADLNLITDIAGIRVGNVHDDDVISGVTAIVFDRETVASATTRGGAPGTRDTDLLRPEMSVQGVHAILLSGGSLFGLDAAGGAVNFLWEHGIGLRFSDAVIPIVSQAITFDLLNGGNKNWARKPPYWDMGWDACAAARSGSFDLGSVGAGYGATTATLRGGLGSASATTRDGIRVAAIAAVNAIGSVTIGEGPHFWAAHVERDSEFGGHGLPNQISAEALGLQVKGGTPPSTTVAVVATDAVLTKPQAKRLAIMADNGLAVAVRPAHAAMDGDTVFAVATQERPITDPMLQITEIGQLAADCLARSVARAVFHARNTSAHYTGPPTYHDVHMR
ncbi:MAG: P1 family peptidase [Hyphomicrobiaceae bacterium]